MMNKVSVGASQDHNPLVMSASAINTVIDAANYYKLQANSRGIKPKQPPRSLNTVTVQNLTGGDLARGAVVQLGDYLLDELNPEALWFQGNVPAAPLDKIAILRDPIIDNKLGTAQVAGVCTALVNVVSTSHGYAKPVAGTALESATTGPIELLQEPDGTGEQELCIRLNSQPGVLMAGVSISGPGATTATVDSRPPGMSLLPGESAGSIPFENPAEITIPDDGLTGFAVYLERDGTRQWELIAEDDESPPTPETPSPFLYVGLTKTTMHEQGETQAVDITFDGGTVSANCINRTYDLPPGVIVIVGWVDEELSIIAASAQSYFGKPASSGGYSAGDLEDFILFEDYTTNLGVTLENVICLTDIPEGAWAVISWNGFWFFARHTREPMLIIEFTVGSVGPPITATIDERPDGYMAVPGETGGTVELVNPNGYDIASGMTGAAWYRGGEWSILNITQECEEE